MRHTSSRSNMIAYFPMTSQKAEPYLESDSYYVSNFKYYDQPFVGEIAVDVKSDKLAGYIYVGAPESVNDGFIQTLEVKEEYRHRGIGTKLLLDAIKKYNAVDLLVDKDNTRAIDLYLKYGFSIAEYDDPDQFYMKIEDVSN